MLAYRHIAFTGPDGLDLVEEPDLQPGPGQVVVGVRATSLNYRDVAIASGAVPWPLEPGRTALSDAAGEVLAVGAGVTRVAVGDRVMSTFFPGWIGGRRRTRPLQYGIEIDGWLAQQAVVSEEAVVPVPAHLSFEEASTLPCAALTAWSALEGVEPGDTVVIQGSGGVSLFAVQLAHARGARVMATTSRAVNVDRLRALGASEVFDTSADPAWATRVQELTDGIGADRILEMGGGATSVAQSIEAVSICGEIALVGLLAPSEEGVSVTDLFLSQSTIRTVGVGHRQDLEAVARAMAAWDLHPVVHAVHDFEQARSAFAAYGEPDQFGKLVIRHG